VGRCARALTAYRDGIKSILDRRFRHEAGRAPDELVQHVKLPSHLREPILQEFYGGVSDRAGHLRGRVGWFDERTNLFPLPEKDRAAKLVR